MKEEKCLIVEQVRGCEGDCLVMDENRVAGPKPWGGGRVVKKWLLDRRQVQEIVKICKRFLGDAPAEDRWIPVTERLPEEHDSIWAAYYGTDKWENWMPRKISDEVAAEITYDNGEQTITKVKAAYTTDGEWCLAGGHRLQLHAAVNRWTPMPEPPKEVSA